MDPLAPALARVLTTLTQELGAVYALDDLVGSVERWRQRPLRIAATTLPADTTGFAIALRDCDAIWVCTRLDPVLRQRTLLHELAHFLLGHLTDGTDAPSVPSYAVFCQHWQTQIDRVYCRTPVGRTLHTSPHEHDAELLALLLQQRIRAHAAQTPVRLQHIYGS